MCRFAPILATAALVACVAAPLRYAPVAPLAAEQINYRAWDELLQANVLDGFVDYPAFGRSLEFASFLAQIRDVQLSEETPAETHLAFLINAYNALAIAGILEDTSPETLWDRYRFFLRKRHAVAGERITLWDLEHERMRPLQEPRIHFAIVCASASCPRLASRAYDPPLLDAQLEAAAASFINDPARNRFDAEGGIAHLSRIFQWYEEDFVQARGSVERYVATYVADPEIARGLAGGFYRVEYLDYDWSLNGKPAAR